jgi:hypothetical protein
MDTRVTETLRGWVIQRWIKVEGAIGETQRGDGGYWLTVYTVAQALSPTFSRISK